MAKTQRAPKRVVGLPKAGKLYGSGARKAASAIMKQYGVAKGRSIFYALANKRAGKGVRGAHRMHGVASTAFAKGSHFKASGKKSGVGRRRLRG